jgi:potassium channel subfamily K
LVCFFIEVGFGDFSPQIPGVRLACVFLLPLSVAVLGEFLTRVASVYIGRQTRRTEREFLNQTMTIADLETMDVDGDGKVQKGEFLAFMLVTLQKVDKEDIDDLLHLFNNLDVSQTGEVSREDVLAGSPTRTPPQSACRPDGVPSI